MKILISAYTFDASAQTITFTGYGSIALANVLLITNVTDNIIIYNFADATKGGSVATNVLTLDYDTTTMDDADKLSIYYEDGNSFNLVKVTDSTDNLDLVKQTDAITDATVGILAHGRNAANQAIVIPVGTSGSPTAGSISIWDNANSITVDDGGATLSIDDAAGSLTVDLNGGTDALIGRVKLTDGTDVALITTAGRLLVEAELSEGTPILQTEATTNGDGYAGLAVYGIEDVGGTNTARVLRLDASGNLLVKLSASDETIGSVEVLSIEPGAGATQLGKAEDAAHTSGDVGVMALAVRRDTAAASGGNGDYNTLNVNNVGKLWVTGTVLEDAASGSGEYANINVAVRTDACVADADVSADGDYAFIRLNNKGQLWTAVDHLYYSKVFSATGADTSIDLTKFPKSVFGLQVVLTTGSVSNWEVAIQGSLDNVNWSVVYVLTHKLATQTLGDMVWTDANRRPCRYIRLNCITFTGASTPSLTAYLIGMHI